jgi:hypothetical protein
VNQPSTTRLELYWESIRDVLRFARSIANRRRPFSAENLLDLFNQAKPSIMEVEDFENPSIPFQKIFMSLVYNYLRQAVTDSLGLLKAYVENPISGMSRAEVSRYPNLPLIKEAIGQIKAEFRLRAVRKHPDILKLLPQQTRDCEKSIKTRVKDVARDATLSRCADFLGEIRCECVTVLESEIDEDVKKLSSNQMSGFGISFTDV